jgi:WD40 repeat protein
LLLGKKLPIKTLGTLKSKDDEPVVMCLTERNAILQFNLQECEPESIKTIVPSFNTNRSTTRELIPSFGSLFVDTCDWLPLVAVGGYDGILRIVNHQTKNVELSHDFGESITGVSLHPNGKYLLLSTVKQVRACSIHQHRLNVVWQISDIPNASVAKFSYGGDRFGITINTVVQVHDSNTPDYKNMSTLRSHSKAIVEFEFGHYGDEVVTIGADSVVCLWDCLKGRVLRRINLLSPAVLSGCVLWNERTATVVTADGRLRSQLRFVQNRIRHEVWSSRQASGSIALWNDNCFFK